MVAFKITDEELARRRAHIEQVLARKPEITLNHFKKAFGYDYAWLQHLRDVEGVKFGKPKRSHLKL